MTELPGTPPYVAEIFRGSAVAIQRYVDILLSRGIDWGLIGPREHGRIWERHIFNSVALLPLMPEGIDVVDIGSGAGLPGLPLALARPDLRLTLLEPLLRRYEFLAAVVDELDLGGRVSVVRGRAEDHEATYDVVTARAVAPLDKLIVWSRPLLRPGGMLLALKGAKGGEELRGAAALLRQFRLIGEVLETRALAQTETTRVVRVHDASAVA